MEELIGRLIHIGMWIFFVIFAFAVVGVIATVRWIVRLVTRTENAVGAGIHKADDALHGRH